jgi:hypothetical protein
LRGTVESIELAAHAGIGLPYLMPAAAVRAGDPNRPRLLYVIYIRVFILERTRRTNERNLFSVRRPSRRDVVRKEWRRVRDAVRPEIVDRNETVVAARVCKCYM